MVSYRVIRGGVRDGFNVDITYLPFSVPRNKVEEVLEKVGRTAGGAGTRVRSARNVRFAGRPAREVVYERPGSATSVLRARVILVGTRLYTVSVATTAAEEKSPKVERFFRSFQLVGADGRPV